MCTRGTAQAIAKPAHGSGLRLSSVRLRWATGRGRGRHPPPASRSLFRRQCCWTLVVGCRILRQPTICVLNARQWGDAMGALDRAVRRLVAVEGVDGRSLISTDGVDPSHADAWLADLMQLSQPVPVLH